MRVGVTPAFSESSRNGAIGFAINGSSHPEGPRHRTRARAVEALALVEVPQGTLAGDRCSRLLHRRDLDSYRLGAIHGLLRHRFADSPRGECRHCADPRWILDATAGEEPDRRLLRVPA